ncbi:MAG: Peptide transport system permease protein SapC, partial [Alphaproteobacteria bacterium MarineAlpha10_Bin3]
ATFALLMLASACLTLVYRRASVSLPRAISLFGTLPGSIPEIVGVIIVWLVMGVFLGWIPLSMEPLGGDPFFYAVQAGGVAAILTLYKLGQVSSLSNFRADFDAGIARTLFDAFTDVLKYFPAWLFSAIILVEVVFHGVGLVGKFVSAVLTLDWMVVRAIAMLAVLAVIVVQIIADISSCLVEQPGEIHGHGPQSTIGAAIFSSSIALFGAGLVLAWFMAAVAAGAISSHDPYEINFGVVLSPPNGEFLFGTDQFGRDIFSRILFGARSIMVVAASAFFIALVVAAGLNLIPGTAKVLISFLASILASFPLLILAILIVAAFGAGHIVGYVGALAIGLLPALYQMIGQTLTEPPEGISTIKHCLQSIGTQSSALVAEGCRHLAYLVGIIFAVDYIGFGIQNPMASWGAMVGTGNLFEQGLLAPWTILAPFAAVVTLTLGLNLLAEGITRKLAKDWS